MLDLTGGKVIRTPPRVLTPTTPDFDDPRLADKNIKSYDIPEKTKLERAIDDALGERDRITAELLDLDNKYDMLQAAIDDQLKDMKIPVTNRSTREAVRAFGGNNEITKDIYDKAKVTLQAISAVMGVNPLHVPFAKITDNGKALTQYSGDILKDCSQITKDFPNKKLFEQSPDKPFVPSQNTALANDNIGGAGKGKSEAPLLTKLEDLINKAKFDMLAFLQYKLFWDIIYHKFLKKLLIFILKLDLIMAILSKYKDKKIIGPFVKKVYCVVVKIYNTINNVPLIFGIRPPPISGDANILKDIKI